MLSPDDFNQRSVGRFPGLLGVCITAVQQGELRSELVLRPELLAPNGFLHAGSVVTLADTTAGYGCVAHLPEGASGFTTVELKSNHLGTAREGVVDCVARAVHLGRSTQVWDATVSHRASGRSIALFRCTQIVLFSR